MACLTKELIPQNIWNTNSTNLALFLNYKVLKISCLEWVMVKCEISIILIQQHSNTWWGGLLLSDSRAFAVKQQRSSRCTYPPHTQGVRQNLKPKHMNLERICLGMKLKVMFFSLLETCSTHTLLKCSYIQ